MHKVGFEWLVVLTCVSIYHSIIKDWKTFQTDDLDSFTTLMWQLATESLDCPYTHAVKLPAQYKTGSETDHHSHPIPGKKCRLLCWLLWSAVSRKWASKCSTAYLSLVQHSVSLLSIQGMHTYVLMSQQHIAFYTLIEFSCTEHIEKQEMEGSWKWKLKVGNAVVVLNRLADCWLLC